MFVYKIGGTFNRPLKQYYCESEEEVQEIRNPMAGEIVMILTDDGLKIKMYRELSKSWIDI